VKELIKICPRINFKEIPVPQNKDFNNDGKHKAFIFTEIYVPKKSAVSQQYPKTVDSGAAILKFWFIYFRLSFGCNALTEYMLCILGIAHDFIN
jgi:hypothetical protein